MKRAAKTPAPQPQVSSNPFPSVNPRPLVNNESALFRDIQAEVSQETQPVLQFIVKNTKYIVGVIVILIAALVGTAGYRMYTQRQMENMQEQLAKIEQRQPDAAQITALEALAADSAERLRPAIWVSLAKSAMAQGNLAKAAEAYGLVAKNSTDKSLGLAGTLGEAGLLMAQGKYDEGAKLIESVADRIPAGVGDQVKVMMAEGAAKAGRYALGAQTYQNLAGMTQGLQAEYYRSRAREFEALGKAPAPAEPAAQPAK